MSRILFASRVRVASAIALTLLFGLGAATVFFSPGRRWFGGKERERADIAREFALGSRWADSLERSLARQEAPRIEPGAAMAALYLERLRLGVGSPFRLIDFALRDPLLPEGMRRRVAEAILARTSVGATYATPPEALDLVSPQGAPGEGLAHRQFMERVTEEADSPRAAELALRLGYTVGAASGVVSHRASAVALGAIAQARDRAFAIRDVEALLREARRQRLDPVDLVPIWRASRRFLVERPLPDPPSADDEREAVRLLPALAREMESLETTAAPAATLRSLGGAAGGVAAELVARRAAPPQAPIAVTMGGYASFVVGVAGVTPDRGARSAFVARARNEEAMVAELARLRGSAGQVSEAGLATLTASVAMRAYAQERAWLPGDDGPSALELQSQLGLAALSFDAKVPLAWRPYYTRMLGDVVSDLRLVFPSLDLRGLTVRFGDSPLAERALALHDPGSRTVYFPLATSAGAMAHELAHDLDWQAARRRYGVRGGYRTDRSMRGYSDQFSATVRRLASASRPRRESLSSSVQADRPTEAFARGVDWFVAAALAHKGRMNGYLSSVQDATITGYASASVPRAGAIERDATLEALREIASVSPEVVSWYDSTYGTGRRLGVADAVRRTLIAPLTRTDIRGGQLEGVNARFTAPRALYARAADGWSCLLGAPSLGGRDDWSLQAAMTFAAEARARGLVRRWGEYARGMPAASARFRALGGAPWLPATSDSVVREVRDAILWRAARPDDGRAGSDFAERAERREAWGRCAMGK